MPDHAGGCLCGRIRYRLRGAPEFPHFCSCRQCQRSSGAPVVAWVDFPLAALAWEGPGGEPAYFRQEETRRGFCPSCGGAICAIDDDSDAVSITIATLDDPGALVPVSHSYPDSAPAWLRVKAEAPPAG